MKIMTFQKEPTETAKDYQATHSLRQWLKILKEN